MITILSNTLRILVGAVLLLALFSVATIASANDIEKKAKRELWLGPIIAANKEYKLHATVGTAVTKNGTPHCVSFKKVEEHNAKINEKINKLSKKKSKLNNAHHETKMATMKQHTEESKAFMKKHGEVAEVLSQRYRNEEISEQQYKTLMAELKEKLRSLDDKYRRDSQAKEDKWAEEVNELGAAIRELSKKRQNSSFSFSLLHTPSDLKAMIMAITDNHPDQLFVEELNKEIQPFLASCDKAPNTGTISHYYANAYPYGQKDVPVASFRYYFEGGQLSLRKCNTPMCNTIEKVTGRNRSLATNPEMTLAGFINSQKEKAHLDGAYRLDFYDEHKRKKGIIYRYDDYWNTYIEFGLDEIVRRIFDGDFKDHTGMMEFKAAFRGLAGSYSKNCKNHVANMYTKTYTISVHDHTSYNMDGSRTNHYRDMEKETRVDSRFMPQYSTYDKSITSSVLSEGPIYALSIGLDGRGIMDRFLEAHGCKAPMVNQLIDNYLRAANGRISAQAEGIEFAGAAKASDLPTKDGLPPPVIKITPEMLEENREHLLSANNLLRQIDQYMEKVEARKKVFFDNANKRFSEEQRKAENSESRLIENKKILEEYNAKANKFIKESEKIILPLRSAKLAVNDAIETLDKLNRIRNKQRYKALQIRFFKKKKESEAAIQKHLLLIKDDSHLPATNDFQKKQNDSQKADNSALMEEILVEISKTKKQNKKAAKNTKNLRHLQDELSEYQRKEAQRNSRIQVEIRQNYYDKQSLIKKTNGSKEELKALTNDYNRVLKDYNSERFQRMRLLKAAEQAISSAGGISKRISRVDSEEERTILEQNLLETQQQAVDALQLYQQTLSDQKTGSPPQAKSVEHSSATRTIGRTGDHKLAANPYARGAGRIEEVISPEEIQKTKEQKAEVRRMRQEMTYSLSQETKRYKKFMGVKVAAYNKKIRALKMTGERENELNTLDKSHQKETLLITNEWKERTQPLNNAEKLLNSAWKALHELTRKGRKTDQERDALRKTFLSQQQLAIDALEEYRQLLKESQNKSE